MRGVYQRRFQNMLDQQLIIVTFARCVNFLCPSIFQTLPFLPCCVGGTPGRLYRLMQSIGEVSGDVKTILLRRKWTICWHYAVFICVYLLPGKWKLVKMRMWLVRAALQGEDSLSPRAFLLFCFPLLFLIDLGYFCRNNYGSSGWSILPCNQ